MTDPSKAGPSAVSTSVQPKTWLDLLSKEVAGTIVRHFYISIQRAMPNQSQGAITDAMLTLASVLGIQCSVVCDALFFKLKFCCTSKDSSSFRQSTAQTSALRKLFRFSISKISFTTNNRNCITYLRPITAPPGLHTAELLNCPYLLGSFSQVTTLQTLSVTFSQDTHLSHLYNAIRKLRLHSLGLVCQPSKANGNQCLFKFFKTPSHWVLLAKCCLHLQEISILCSCKDRSTPRDISPLLMALPDLQAVTPDFRIGKPALQSLCKMTEVRINAQRDLFFLGSTPHAMFPVSTTIGGPVTSVFDHRANSNWKKVLCGGKNKQYVMSLRACTNLRKIELLMWPEAESGLPELKQLRVLNLCWNFKFVEYGWERKRYIRHALPSSFFRKLLATMVDLRELSLFRVIINMSDIEAVMSTLGQQLEVFGSSLFNQTESNFDRLFAVMDTVGRHCPVLRRLEIRHDVEEGSFISKYETFKRKLCIGRKLLYEIELLRRRAPLWDYGSFHSSLMDQNYKDIRD